MFETEKQFMGKPARALAPGMAFAAQTLREAAAVIATADPRMGQAAEALAAGLETAVDDLLLADVTKAWAAGDRGALPDREDGFQVGLLLFTEAMNDYVADTDDETLLDALDIACDVWGATVDEGVPEFAATKARLEAKYGA